MPGYENSEIDLSLVRRAVSYLKGHPISADEWNSDVDNSVACQEAKEHYSLCLRLCLSESDWTFAKKRAYLLKDLMENPDYDADIPDSNPEIPFAPIIAGYPEYSYRFLFPIGLVEFREIRNIEGNIIKLSRRDAKVFRQGDESRKGYLIEGGFIYSNIDNIICDYTFYETNIDKWSPSFIEAFCFRLAAEIGKELTNSIGTVNAMWAKYDECLKKAKNKNALTKGPRLIY